ncbi:unnamed protein product [Owenia fusiformis]|uniref:Uncharacterized protein n=1 Tax=Owenia fusiformis TaxID=6347 RepID=A0A8J1Y534_OWEFU|nr:unnamed protein product [Owenia fusiformis]
MYSMFQLLPYYILDVFGRVPGIPGIFLATIISAALSTVSSFSNSVATTMWVDWISKCRPMSESQATACTKFLVMVVSILSTAIALIAYKIPGQLLQVIISLGSACGGSTAGMYILGVFTRRCNWKGAVVGTWVGLAFVLWIAIGSFTMKPSFNLHQTPISGCTPLSYNTTDAYMNDSITAIPTLYTTPVDGYLDQGITSIFTVSTSKPKEQPTTRPLDRLYSISYVWFNPLGIGTCFVVGILVSLLTGKWWYWQKYRPLLYR